MDRPAHVGASGRVHVALRGGRSIASFDLGGILPVTRTEVCDLPRGLAYDGTAERLYVACADGALVQLDLLTGLARIPIRLGRDLRDVIVRACASCHAEAADDGHVWNFEGIGHTSQLSSIQIGDVVAYLESL